MVIPFHAWLIYGGAFVGPLAKGIVKHGWAGVELFFVLSGFLIGTQVVQAARRDGRVGFGRFYLKRCLRILPSYYAVLALYYLWPAFREKPELDAPWRFLLFVTNYERSGAAFSHAWSLCVEEHFYLAFPALVAACLWRPQVFRPAVLIGGVFVVSILLRYRLWTEAAPFFPSVYRPSHTHLDGLTVGVALALLRATRPAAWTQLTSRPWLLSTVGVLSVLGGMWMYQDLSASGPYALTFPVIACGFGALLVAAVTPGFWLAKRRVPGAAAVATLAYTLYLTHKQMIHLATVVIGDYNKAPVATVALSALFVVGAAVLLHVLVERPGLHLRDRLLELRKP